MDNKTSASLQDVFEIKADSIAAGDKVVLVDDLLATGGECAERRFFAQFGANFFFFK